MHEFMTKTDFYFMKTIADWHVYINGIESFINSLLQRKANLLEYFCFCQIHSLNTKVNS